MVRLPIPQHGIEFVLMAPSEDGFWSNDWGWVYDIQDATRFTREDIADLNEPVVSGDDAEWVAVAFEDQE